MAFNRQRITGFLSNDGAQKRTTKPNTQAEGEAAPRASEDERLRRAEEQQKNRENNQRLLDSVLDRLPTTLGRDDYEILVLAAIDRLDSDDWAAITDRYQIELDESREPGAANCDLRKNTESATEALLVRMLVEIALLRSGYSDELLEMGDPLSLAVQRYNPSLGSKRTQMKPAKSASKAVKPDLNMK